MEKPTTSPDTLLTFESPLMPDTLLCNDKWWHTSSILTTQKRLAGLHYQTNGLISVSKCPYGS
jgi:hypothetical protein